MLVSSTSMNVAMVTTSAMAHGFLPPVQPVAKYPGVSVAGISAAAATQSRTFDSTDIPARRRSIPGCAVSSLRRTGMRWTTFT